MLKLLNKEEYEILASAMDDKYQIYLDERRFEIEAKEEDQLFFVQRIQEARKEQRRHIDTENETEEVKEGVG